MRDFGETDDRTRKIKVNVKASKEFGKKHDNWATKGGAVANSIQHEIIHAKHNDMSEREVRKRTPIELEKMSKKTKQKLYKYVQD